MRAWAAAVALLVAAVPGGASAAPAADEGVAIGAGWEGQVEVRSRRLDAAWVRPGADFRGFRKVIVGEPEVAMRRNWQRDANAGRRGMRRVGDADEARILAAAQANFSDIAADSMRRAGYRLVSRPGPDVMTLRTAIVNIVVNAPDGMAPGRSRTFTANAGEATLVVEVRDSETNELLARVLDRRETLRNPGISSSVTSLADFRTLFRSWTAAMTRGLQVLKDHSPIPDPLTPGQRLE